MVKYFDIRRNNVLQELWQVVFVLVVSSARQPSSLEAGFDIFWSTQSFRQAEVLP